MKHNNFEAEVSGTDYEFKKHYLEDMLVESFVEDGLTKDLIVDKGEVSNNVWKRYRTLKRNNFTCVSCGLKADRYIKLKSKTTETNKTFNRYFYAYFTIENHTRRVFTIDHIMPRSIKGDKSILCKTGNYQTMCRKCNETKGATFKRTDVFKVKTMGKMQRIAEHLKAIWNEIF